MIALRRILIAIVALEVLVCGGLIIRRLWHPAPPDPQLGRMDSLTAEQLERVRTRTIHGDGDDWKNYAQALLGQGFYPEAEQAFRVAVRVSPDDQEAVYGLGFCLERMGRLEESIPVLEQAASMSDDQLSETCWYQIGRNHLRLENVPEAEEAFRRIAEFPAAAFHLAKIELRTGRAAEAVPKIEPVLVQHPNSVKLIQLRARAADELGDEETAREYYDRELRGEAKLTLEYGMSFFMLYRSKYGLEKDLANCLRLRDAGTIAERVHCIDSAMRIIKSENLIQYAQVYISQAEIALGLGQPERALSLLEEARPLTFETPWILQLRGEALFQLKRTKEAQETWERSLALRATPDVHQRLALYLEGLGQSDEANRHRARAHQLMGQREYEVNRIEPAHEQFLKASDIDPSMPITWYYLGETHRLKGEIGSARSAYEKCLELDEHYQRARVALQHLEPNPPDRD